MTFLDDPPPYPFGDPVAQALLTALTQVHGTVAKALFAAQRAGLDTLELHAEQAPRYLWRDIVTLAASRGQLRRLVQTARDPLHDGHPYARLFDDVLAGHEPALEGEARTDNGEPAFLTGSDLVTVPEALQFGDDLTLEIGQVPALIAALSRLVELAPAVCRLDVRFRFSRGYGTAFRIGEDRLLTNWHVLHSNGDGRAARTVTAVFGDEDDGQGGRRSTTAVPCDVDTIDGVPEDDWAVIRLREPLGLATPIIRVTEQGVPEEAAPAYIVQHPRGQTKRVAYVRNKIVKVHPRVLHYLSDTETGSSGSPIFDAAGHLIGIHRAGGDPQAPAGDEVRRNEGVRVGVIAAGLESLA